MNDQFTRQAQEMFKAVNGGFKMPENLQVLAEDSVAKSREAYEKFAVVAKDNAKAAEEVILTAQAGAKTLGEKVLNNALANTEAAFDAAEAMARAKSLPEAAQLQANFVQKQMAIAGAQTKEFFELSSKIAKQTFETMNTAAAKSFEQIKKAG